MQKVICNSTFVAFLFFIALNCRAQFLDPSFGSGGKAGPFNNGFYPAGPGNKIQSAQNITLDNGGKIWIAGHQSNGTNEDMAIMRLNSDGTPDMTYGTNGVTRFNDLGGDEYATAISYNLPEATCIMAGYRWTTDANGLSSDIVVMQLNADGSINNNFGQQGVRIIDEARNEEVYSIAFGTGTGTNGIFLGGFTNPDFIDFNNARGRIYRLSNMGGNVSSTVVDYAGAKCHVYSIAIDANGNILAAGDNDGGPSRFIVARFLPNGSYDNSFDGDGKAFIDVGNSSAGVSSIKVQNDGKILAAGGLFDVNTGFNGTVVARLNSDGSLDNNFSGGSKYIPFSYTGIVGVPRSIVMQADGKILVSGQVDGASSVDADFGVARLNADGSIDNGFGTNGIYSLDFNNTSIDFNNAFVLLSDGKLLTGSMTRASSNDSYLAGLMRLQFTQPVTCITGPTQACDRTTVVFQGPSGFSPESYAWTITGNGSILTVPGPTVQVFAGGGSGGINTFTLTLKLTVNGQSSTCSTTVTVTPSQSCSIQGIFATCVGNIDPFETTANGANYKWSVNGGGTIQGSDLQPRVSIQASSDYTVNLFYTDGGCSYVCSKAVTVKTPAPCDITGPTSVNSSSTGNIYTGPTGLTTYSWGIQGNGTIVGSTTGQSVSVNAGSTASFTLTLTTSFNICNPGTCSYLVTVNPVSACTYSQDFYSKKNNKGCSTGVSTTVTQFMLNAFGSSSFKVFGNAVNKQLFTLYKSDVNNGNIFKMLPGFDGSYAISKDAVAPFDGAFYSDKSTWSLVPIPVNGMQKGSIGNQLLSQLITLWFNLGNNSSLGTIPLTNNVLTTTALLACGSKTTTGSPLNFSLPSTVINYLNGQNVYSWDVNGLFQLSNDVLGGVVTAISPADAETAIEVINNAFNGCRMLVGTTSQSGLITKANGIELKDQALEQKLSVNTFPNPYSKQFHLQIKTPLSGIATLEFFDIIGAKIYEMKTHIKSNMNNLIDYSGPGHTGNLIYRLSIANLKASGLVIHAK